LRRRGEIHGTEAEFLQAQAMVLLGLADPLHANAPHCCRRAGVGWPDEGDDLIYVL
jgi:hypothetical protein